MNLHKLHEMPRAIVNYHSMDMLFLMPMGHNRARRIYKLIEIIKSPWVNPRGWRATKKLDPSWKPPKDVA